MSVKSFLKKTFLGDLPGDEDADLSFDGEGDPFADPADTAAQESTTELSGSSAEPAPKASAAAEPTPKREQPSATKEQPMSGPFAYEVPLPNFIQIGCLVIDDDGNKHHYAHQHAYYVELVKSGMSPKAAETLIDAKKKEGKVAIFARFIDDDGSDSQYELTDDISQAITELYYAMLKEAAEKAKTQQPASAQSAPPIEVEEMIAMLPYMSNEDKEKFFAALAPKAISVALSKLTGDDKELLIAVVASRMSGPDASSQRSS